MTDRIQHLTVVLDDDVRIDDVEGLVRAISMLRGVERVSTGKPVDSTDHLARSRARQELRTKVLGLLLDDAP